MGGEAGENKIIKVTMSVRHRLMQDGQLSDTLKTNYVFFLISVECEEVIGVLGYKGHVYVISP